MLMYTIKRLIAGVITVWFIATATFIAMHQVPGDPLMNDKAVTAEIRANLEKKYGLDKPVTHQYFIFLGNMLQGDFGISFTQQNRRVNDIIQDHFPVSATLGILAILFASMGGILWGALTAIYRNRMPDIIIMFLVILGIHDPCDEIVVVLGDFHTQFSAPGIALIGVGPRNGIGSTDQVIVKQAIKLGIDKAGDRLDHRALVQLVSDIENTYGGFIVGTFRQVVAEFVLVMRPEANTGINGRSDSKGVD